MPQVIKFNLIKSTWKITYYVVVHDTCCSTVEMKLKKFSVDLQIKSDENCATEDKLSCDDALSVIGKQI